LKAQVYYSTGGKNPVYTYLTPLEVDPADDDIDPVTADVVDGKISISPGFVTNSAGTTESYGNPVSDTTYTVALSSSNYAPFSVQSECAASDSKNIAVNNVDTDNHLNFTVNLTSDSDVAGIAVAALYNSKGELIATKYENAENEISFSFENPVGVRNVKVMWWDSLKDMTPQTKAVIGTVEYYSGYVLMNIPYAEFYGAESVSVRSDDSSKINIDYDAVSSATNKVGNYGKSGGAYHSGTTAEIAEDGTVTAVGADNDATLQGVIWPVKVEDASVLSSLGGTAVTDSSEVTVATLGRGQTSYTELSGYQTLTEAADYSYYVLRNIPDYYMELSIENGVPVFTANSGTVTTENSIAPTVSYGTNWGDVQLDLTAAEDAADKQINAMVITAEDKNGNTVKSGLIHLYNIWSYSDIAWRNAQLEGLNGATITNIRYYCNNKAENVSELEYYIYDYPMNLELLPAYDGEVTAEFDGSGSILLTGLPEDIQNLKAQVYYSTGGKNPVYTYLTPLVVDPADDDIDPTTVDVVNGKITISPGSVTNNAGTTESYGNPVSGTTYTIALSSDNYAPFTVQAEYTE
ncbi:MAG: hypothetical protein ACI4EA_02300, partial [Candidatus Ornithomonoglobus sp.]